MIIYFPIIFLSTLLVYFAEKFHKVNGLFILFSAMALLVLSVFAGCRDLTVGYDVMLYEYGVYKSAHYSDSFIDLLNSDVSGIEFIFLLINYIGVKLYDNIHFVLGFISFITSLFAYLACIRYKKNAPLWLLFAGYLLLNYASSLNIMRQNVAVAICLYAYTILKDNGLSRSFYVVATLAMFSHNTAIIPIAALFFYYFIPKMSPKIYNRVLFILLLGISVVYYSIDHILSSVSLILQKNYTKYSDFSITESGWAELVIPYTYIVFIGLLFYCSMIGKKKGVISIAEWNEYKCTILICIFIFIMGATLTGSMLRLAYYFITFCIFYIVQISYHIITSRDKRILVNILLILLFVFMFFKTTAGSVDYSSTILSI